MGGQGGSGCFTSGGFTMARGWGVRGKSYATPSPHERHMPPFPWPTQTMRSLDLGMHPPLQLEWRVGWELQVWVFF
jgi:hypothetical protein